MRAIAYAQLSARDRSVLLAVQAILKGKPMTVGIIGQGHCQHVHFGKCAPCNYGCSVRPVVDHV